MHVRTGRIFARHQVSRGGRSAEAPLDIVTGVDGQAELLAVFPRCESTTKVGDEIVSIASYCLSITGAYSSGQERS